MEIQSDIFFNFSLFLKELESGNSLENTGGLERYQTASCRFGEYGKSRSKLPKYSKNGPKQVPQFPKNPFSPLLSLFIHITLFLNKAMILKGFLYKARLWYEKC